MPSAMTRYQMAREAGKCCRCLWRPAMKNRSRCRYCKPKQNSYQANYRAQQKARKDVGLPT